MPAAHVSGTIATRFAAMRAGRLNRVRAHGDRPCSVTIAVDDPSVICNPAVVCQGGVPAIVPLVAWAIASMSGPRSVPSSFNNRGALACELYSDVGASLLFVRML